MFNDTYTHTFQRYPLRHPDNNNLHLHYGEAFEGLPVMVDKGPFIQEYLSDLKHTIDLAMAEYPRVLAFRVDLRLPQGIDLPEYAYTNQVISRFIDSFNAKIKCHRGQLREKQPVGSWLQGSLRLGERDWSRRKAALPLGVLSQPRCIFHGGETAFKETQFDCSLTGSLGQCAEFAGHNG